jgi:hypothetical protein
MGPERVCQAGSDECDMFIHFVDMVDMVGILDVDIEK